MQPCGDKEDTRFQNDRPQGYLPHGTHRHARYGSGMWVTVDRGTAEFSILTAKSIYVDDTVARRILYAYGTERLRLSGTVGFCSLTITKRGLR